MPASVTSDVDVADGGSYFHAVRVPVSYLGCANKGIPLIKISLFAEYLDVTPFWFTFFFALFSEKVYSGPLLLLDF